jgi:putative ABC transport system permease protein
MFDLDSWQEIISTLRKNRLRTILTAISVFWGILMLILLLGAGKGLENGARSNFSDNSKNKVWVSHGNTTMPYAGFNMGRHINLEKNDYINIKNKYHEIDKITYAYNIWGGNLVEFKGNYNWFSFRTVDEKYLSISNSYIKQGRFINPIDMKQCRKVAVIGMKVKQTFGENEKYLGEYIIYNDIPFKIVGIFNDDHWEWETNRIYIPVTTAQKLFGSENEIHDIIYTSGDYTFQQTEATAEDIRNNFARKYNFHPDDQGAIHIWRNGKEYERTFQLFRGISIFIWIIGIGTLLAGIIGVSNIMLIIVKERLKEFGIRKAIGASPGSIIQQIIMESILITSIAGYAGIITGNLILDMLKKNIPPGEFFQDPEVGLGVAIWATIILIISGTLAGYLPARYAAKVKPVEVLTNE